MASSTAVWRRPCCSASTVTTIPSAKVESPSRRCIAVGRWPRATGSRSPISNWAGGACVGEAARAMYSTDQKAAVGARSFASVADLLDSQLARHGNSVATRHDTGERYVDTGYAEVLANSRALAHWFLA